MSPETTAWLEAAKILARNPEMKLECPSCKIGTIVVKDEPHGVNKLERWLICDKCGRWETILNPIGK